MSAHPNPPAFPTDGRIQHGTAYDGMSLRDWFAGQALANSALCTGHAPDWQLRAWFGERGGLRREEIAARAAYEFADAMLAEREKSS